mgnify:CR=1 FL=1|tara:strand:+ start:123 stop:308 length:186 start_codon:yes stop_codon:yes gene_type:complete
MRPEYLTIDMEEAEERIIALYTRDSKFDLRKLRGETQLQVYCRVYGGNLKKPLTPRIPVLP